MGEFWFHGRAIYSKRARRVGASGGVAPQGLRVGLPGSQTRNVLAHPLAATATATYGRGARSFAGARLCRKLEASTMTDPSTLPPRPVSYSAVREQVHMVFPNDLNARDTVFGGLIMAQMDRVAVVVADRHAAGTCVTVGVDAVHFIAPARRGDILIFNAGVNRAWGTSMEVGCKVEAELGGGGERRHILSAYLTFVAMDENSRPRPVSPLLPETPIEHRRFEEAALRRKSRLEHAEALRRLRADHAERPR
jgi:acyl-CoA hydrolase